MEARDRMGSVCFVAKWLRQIHGPGQSPAGFPNLAVTGTGLAPMFGRRSTEALLLISLGDQSVYLFLRCQVFKLVRRPVFLLFPTRAVKYRNQSEVFSMYHMGVGQPYPE